MENYNSKEELEAILEQEIDFEKLNELCGTYHKCNNGNPYFMWSVFPYIFACKIGRVDSFKTGTAANTEL